MRACVCVCLWSVCGSSCLTSVGRALTWLSGTGHRGQQDTGLWFHGGMDQARRAPSTDFDGPLMGFDAARRMAMGAGGPSMAERWPSRDSPPSRVALIRLIRSGRRG